MNGEYERLEADAERPASKAADHRAAWDRLTPLDAADTVVRGRVEVFARSKRISLEALAALGTRVRVDRNGGVELAWGYPYRNGSGEIISAVKYRPLDPAKKRYAEPRSVFVSPLVLGRRDSLDVFLAEGESDACRIYDLVGDVATVLVLPAGALTFKPRWADVIPRGATIYLCHDADDAGDKGAAKAARIIGRNTVRVRPPDGDWCEWAGSREQFVQLVQAAKGAQPGSALTATPLAAVEMRSIEWYERPLWQKSAFQLLAGAKGAGKGTYLAGLAARFSRTGSNVMLVSTEDSTAIDLKPRLVAADAAIQRCYVIEQHVRLPDDVENLRALAVDLGGVGLFVIDPVANHIGNRSSNDDSEVRDAIAPLNRLADELGCLLIGVRHPGKDRSRGAVASILGSTAWVDTPRAVVMIAVDDEDPTVRVIQVVAGNRSLGGSAQAFRIDAVDVPGLVEPITLAVALGESAKSVDDLLAVKKTESKTAKARELILDILETDGDVESDTLDARVARETGLAAQTIRNTRTALKNEGLVKAFPDKDEFGGIVCWKVSRSGAPRP